jgi:hypothetical protein
LNKLLALRDYLHIPKWEIDKMRQTGVEPTVEPGSQLHKILETAVDLYLEHLDDPKNKYHTLAVPHYQEALQLLACFNLRYRNCPTPPFSLATVVTAGVGGPARTDVQPEVTWFRSMDEAATWLTSNMRVLAKQIAPYPDAILDEMLPIPNSKQKKVRFEDTGGELLGLGKDRIDKHGILV